MLSRLLASFFCLVVIALPASAQEYLFVELAHGDKRLSRSLDAHSLSEAVKLDQGINLNLRPSGKTVEQLDGLAVSALSLPGETLVATLGNHRRMGSQLDLQYGVSGIVSVHQQEQEVLTGEGLGVGVKLRFRPREWVEAAAGLAYAELFSGSLLPETGSLQRLGASVSLRMQLFERLQLETSLTRRSETAHGLLNASLRWML